MAVKDYIDTNDFTKEELLDMIEDPEHQPTLVRVSDPQLIVRQSTARVRRRQLKRV